MRKNTIILIILLIFSFSLFISADTDAEEIDNSVERNIILGSMHIEGRQNSNIYFGRYQQTSIGSTQPTVGAEGIDYIKNESATSFGYGPYYSIDPVKWRVLSVSDEDVFLFSDKIIESRRFHEHYGYISWDTCTMRSWLNGYGEDANACSIDYRNDNFIGSVFSLNEIEFMRKTSVAGEEDILFLLSPDEVCNTNYGFAADNTSDGANGRTANYTQYHRGADLGGNWWLRTSPPMGYPCDKSYVYASNGYIKYGGSSVYHNSLGVRPAFWLKLSDVLFTSGTASDGYALTFLDSDRSFAVKDVSEKNVYPGDEVSFEYTGAFVGDNEYISAIIADSDDNVVEYMQLQKADTGNDNITFNIATDLQEGTYTLKIFNEQYNGEKKTSYSSDFVNITLNVKNKPEFKILSCSTFEDKTIATISIPQIGTYHLIFADYESEKTNDTDVVTITVTEDKIGEITQASEKKIVLGPGDKIMLWADMTTISPKCEAYIVK